MRIGFFPLAIAVFSTIVVVKAADLLWMELGFGEAAETAEFTEPDAAEVPERPARPAFPAVEPLLSPAAGDEDEEEAGEGDTVAEAEAMDASDGMIDASVRDPFDLSDEEIELLQQLAERREELQRRARDMDRRAALLEAAEGRIEQKIKELEDLQSLIESLLVKHDEQEEAQMRSLVKIYESMKPKDAARIFEELDMVVLLEVIERMKERKSAPILAKMNPAKAKAVTLELAQRRELPVARD
ncbi:MAG: hypothetical protein MI920_33150 [Kiloniellales bacterium]|nr:hypothetical protein [Kiloniellales bacterium]